MRFPSIAHVRAALVDEWRTIRQRMSRADLVDPYDRGNDSASVDVRLQVYPDGSWALRSGDSSYDTDHRGSWGASCLSWERQDLTSLARELIDQARDHHAQAEA